MFHALDALLLTDTLPMAYHTFIFAKEGGPVYLVTGPTQPAPSIKRHGASYYCNADRLLEVRRQLAPLPPYVPRVVHGNLARQMPHPVQMFAYLSRHHHRAFNQRHPSSSCNSLSACFGASGCLTPEWDRPGACKPENISVARNIADGRTFYTLAREGARAAGRFR